MILMLGGAALGLRAYKQSRPQPMWVPLPVNTEVPVDKQEEVAESLKVKLLDKALLVQVSKDLGLTREWELATDEACADELKKRAFVRLSEMDSPMGRVPAMHIGVNGTRAEQEMSGKIAMRLMQDVWKILGIQPPAAKDEL